MDRQRAYGTYYPPDDGFQQYRQNMAQNGLMSQIAQSLSKTKGYQYLQPGWCSNGTTAGSYQREQHNTLTGSNTSYDALQERINDIQREIALLQDEERRETLFRGVLPSASTTSSGTSFHSRHTNGWADSKMDRITPQRIKPQTDKKYLPDISRPALFSSNRREVFLEPHSRLEEISRIRTKPFHKNLTYSRDILSKGYAKGKRTTGERRLASTDRSMRMRDISPDTRPISISPPLKKTRRSPSTGDSRREGRHSSEKRSFTTERRKDPPRYDRNGRREAKRENLPGCRRSPIWDGDNDGLRDLKFRSRRRDEAVALLTQLQSTLDKCLVEKGDTDDLLVADSSDAHVFKKLMKNSSSRDIDDSHEEEQQAVVETRRRRLVKTVHLDDAAVDIFKQVLLDKFKPAE